MRKLVVILLGLLLVTSGCSILLEDQGETGIRYGTEITFFSRASTTNATSAATVDIQPAVDYFIQLQGTKPDEDSDAGTDDGG